MMAATSRTEPIARGTNGFAMAAIVGAGIGAFGMAAVVLLAESGVWSAPAIYAPAGGLSGRTTVAVAVWLVSWAVLYLRWRRRDVDPARAFAATLILIAAGVLGTFPPFWQIF
jgi:hypothetical protein